MPLKVFAEMRFRAAGVVPPIVTLAGPVLRRIPAKALPSPAVPAGLVPMKLPAITMPSVPSTRMPELAARLRTSPRTALPSAVGMKCRIASTVRAPVFVPSISIMSCALVPSSGPFVFATAPGWVYPSIVVGPVICGRAEAGTIVWTPEPTMLNSIVSAPPAALASMMACRREPAPESLTLVTVKVAAPEMPETAPRTIETSVTSPKRENRIGTPFRSNFWDAGV